MPAGRRKTRKDCASPPLAQLLCSTSKNTIPPWFPSWFRLSRPWWPWDGSSRRSIGPGAKIVFIGPCIAKKAEADDPEVAGDIDAVLTFVELEAMFKEAGISLGTLPERKPDGPTPGLGRIFPVPGGLLRSAALKEDILQNQILVTEGKEACTQILNELLEGAVEARFLDLLFCEGCINGPAFPNELSVFARKERVARYVQEQQKGRGEKLRRAKNPKYEEINLQRTFSPEDHRLPTPSYTIIREILRRTNKIHPEDELNCGACGYSSCQEKASAVYWGLAENEMCLPYLIDQLEENLSRLAQSHRDLREAQQQLIQSEKMASVGQLAAGVAHEVNNPLGTILLYSHMMLEKLSEKDARREELDTIAKEAARCRDIVRGLLDFARQRRLQIENIEINRILRETAALAVETAFVPGDRDPGGAGPFAAAPERGSGATAGGLPKYYFQRRGRHAAGREIDDPVPVHPWQPGG